MTQGATRVVVWAADGSPVPGGSWSGPLVRRLRSAGFEVVEVPLERRPPSPEELAAPLHVLSGGMTPSSAGVPWMAATRDAVAQLVTRAVAGEARAVGICLGSQLLAGSLAGSDVAGPSPRGMEAGLHAVHATDPTAEPSSHVVAELHHHAIDADRLVAAGATVTLANDHTPVQGFSFGAGVTGYQFHPELDPAGIGAVVRANGPLLRATGVDPAEAAATVRRRAAAWDPTTFDRLVVERLVGRPGGGATLGTAVPAPQHRRQAVAPLPRARTSPCAASPSPPTASTAAPSTRRSPA